MVSRTEEERLVLAKLLAEEKQRKKSRRHSITFDQLLKKYGIKRSEL